MPSPRCLHTGLPKPFCAHCVKGFAPQFEDDPRIPKPHEAPRVESLGTSSVIMRTCAQDTRVRRWTNQNAPQPWGLPVGMDPSARIVMFARALEKKKVDRHISELLDAPTFTPVPTDKVRWCWKCKHLTAHLDNICHACHATWRSRSLY